MSTQLPGVREKLTEIQDAAIKDGRINPDLEGAGAAALLPNFSKGTVPLDNDGHPITSKEREVTPFTDGHVPLPEGTETTGGTAEAAPAPAPEAPPAPAPGAAAGAAAAEAAAQAAAEEWDEFEFEDPDIQAKFQIRAPKKYAEIVQRGYARRASYDRARSFLSDAEPVLRPLIEDGRIRAILPYIQLALENPEYGTLVTQMGDRARQGLPLIEQARAEAAAAGAAATAPAQMPDVPNLDLPWVDPAVLEVRQRQDRLEAEQRRWNEERENQARTQQEQEARNRQVVADMRGAHEDLAAMYPGIFNTTLGANDPAWVAAVNHAREGAYTNKYGLRAGIVFGAQQWRAVEAERVAATGSSAAQVLAQAETRLLDAARHEARNSAGAVAGGTVAASVPAPTPPKPMPTNPDGSLKPRDQFMAEVMDWQTKHGRLKNA